MLVPPTSFDGEANMTYPDFQMKKISLLNIENIKVFFTEDKNLLFLQSGSTPEQKNQSIFVARCFLESLVLNIVLISLKKCKLLGNLSTLPEELDRLWIIKTKYGKITTTQK